MEMLHSRLTRSMPTCVDFRIYQIRSMRFFSKKKGEGQEMREYGKLDLKMMKNV